MPPRLPLILLLTSVFLRPGLTAAQGPLSIEQLIMESSRMQIATGIELLSALSPAGERRDTQVTSALRYGIATDFELNATLGALTRDDGGQRADRQTLGLGANWQAMHEGRLPALVLEGRLDAISRVAGEDRMFSTGAVAATIYRSVDPVVLSLSVVGTGAFADTTGGLPAGESSSALASYFSELPAGSVELLDPVQMEETRGEIWPLIGAVVTIDLALATFFWGTYVPSVTGNSWSGRGLYNLP